MVLEFEEGGSFKAWLKGLKRAPRQPELDRILAPLLDALELVHKGDYLHRDIAPDNIIIRKDGSPVLIDFGSARGEIASHSKTVSALVKPGYSPYEQYATTSSKQGPWTDIYALGATLYHALSGKRPPDAPSRMVNDEYVSARDAALSSYRPAFLAAIDKALRLEVGERPQSIAEWRKTLLAPEPKRDGRLSLARALRAPAHGRLQAEAGTGAAAEHRAAERHAEPGAGASRRAAAQGPAPRLHRGLEEAPPRACRQERRCRRPAAAPAPASSPAAVRQPRAQQFGLGYGPPREHAASVSSAGRAVAAVSQSVERPRAGGACAPRPASAAARARLARAVAALALASLQAADRARHRRSGSGLPGPAAAAWKAAAPTSSRARPRIWRRPPASWPTEAR